MGSSKFFGYKVVVGACILGLLHQGGTAVFSIFLPSMAESVNVSIGVLMYAVTITTAFAVLGSLILSKIIGKIGIKKCLFVATICACASMLICSVAPNVMVIFIGCVFTGMQLALGTTATLSILIGDWFIEKRSQMIGFIMGFLYLGNVIMMFIASRLQLIFNNWRTCYAIVGIIIFVGGLLANFLLIRTPEQMKQKPLGWDKQSNVHTEISNDEAEATGITISQAMKSVAFPAMLVACTGLAIACETVSSYGPTYYTLYGVDDLTASNIAMLFVFISFLSGLLAGWIAEKFGNKAFTGFVGICLVIGLAVLAYWPATFDIKILAASIIVIGLGMPAAQQLAPTLSMEIFGKKAYDSVSSILIGGVYAGSALSAVLMNIVIAATGEMKICYIVDVIIVILALVLISLAIITAPAKRKR